MLLAFLLIWQVVLLGLSGWLLENGSGDLSNDSFRNETSTNYNKWNDFCYSTPYYYLRPFAFTFEQADGTTSDISYCGFPPVNSDFRIAICVLGFCTVLALLFNTPLSYIARTLFVLYGLLFFAVAVLDMNRTAVGYASCENSFGYTHLKEDLATLNTTLSCVQDDYAGLCVVDLMVSFQYFFLYLAWQFCKNKYNMGESDGKYAADIDHESRETFMSSKQNQDDYL